MANAIRKPNKGADGREAKNLTCFYVQNRQGDSVPLAMTDHEFSRAHARAMKNPEDLPSHDCGFGVILFVTRAVGKLLKGRKQ